MEHISEFYSRIKRILTRSISMIIVDYKLKVFLSILLFFIGLFGLSKI